MHKIKVWDLPTRLFHWTLVASMIFMFISAKQGGTWLQWHLRCGLFLLALILFRIVWGFVGSDTARFTQFVKSPKQIIRYIKGEITENEQPGHNPLGALMVVALILGILFQLITGLFSPDENSYIYGGYLSSKAGENASQIRSVHLLWANVLMILAGIHFAVVLFYRVIKRHNLITPMITGNKHLNEPLPKLKFASIFKALIVFIITAALSYFITLIK
ncbi:MAG: cytochrome b/b6 domain-containing protein [Neisseriaceae bacterium]|nr:cytochrome b/b6 domain-containing protein [Neisseriaceae bacterium]